MIGRAFALLWVVAFVSRAAAAPADPAVRYRLAIDEQARTQSRPLVTVEIAAAPAPLELVFPAWLPGAYELRFFGRDVAQLEAAGERGEPLRVRRDGPSRVFIEGHAPGSRVTIHYRTSAELLSDDGADVGPEHAYLNPGAIVPLVRGLEARPHELLIDVLPAGWRAYVAGDAATAGPPRLAADSYFALVDEPIEAAAEASLLHAEAEYGGARFVVVIHADRATRERAKTVLPAIMRDLGKIVAAERAIAGPLPFARSLVVMHLSDRAARMAALEHAAAATIVGSAELVTPEGYMELLHVFSHELFHTWNARRLVPAELVTPDFEHVQTSAALWITEGLTEHASSFSLARAGLSSRAQLGTALGEALTRARHAEHAELSVETLARLAFAAPTSLATDPDAYYAIGHVVSLAIIAELLGRSHGRVGLEELLARLLPPLGAPPRALDTAVLGRALDALVPAEKGEAPLSNLLTAWVTKPFSLDALLPSLARAGLHIQPQRQSRLDLLVLVTEGEPPTLRAIEPGGAFQRAGARAGDLVLQLEDRHARARMLTQLVARTSTAPITLDVLRAGEPLSFTLYPRMINDEQEKVTVESLSPSDRETAVRLSRLLGMPIR